MVDKAADTIRLDHANAGARLAEAKTTMGQWMRSALRAAKELPLQVKFFLSAGLVFAVLIVGLFSWLGATLPLSEALKPLPNPAMTFVGSDGVVFARRGSYKEDPVTIEEVPDHLIDALLSVEDQRYYYHFGIDPLGITRAILRNWQAGKIVEGGSTITQQLAKFTFLSLNRTYERKIQEALLALWLETQLSKDEILVRYLSSAYFGSGVYGLRAASRFYFDKAVSELSVAESALLVGILRAPSKLAPMRNLEGAQERARLVLSVMVENGKLDAKKVIEMEPAQLAETNRQLHVGSYFADWVSDDLPEIEGRYGDVRVETTLDTRLQSSAEEIITNVLADDGEKRDVSQAALVAMRPDGSIVAMVGGTDYKESQFNRATQAQRQPGSAFKLFVYLAALRDGASLNSSVPDRPIKIGTWQPSNFDGKFRGRVSLHSAFTNSLNVPAVVLSEKAGRDAVIGAARDLGIKSELKNTPSLALGASEVNVLELTAAYASVASENYPVRPNGVKSIEGEWLAPAPPTTPLDHAREMKTLMHSVVQQGTGRGARIGIPAFGKTGTSQEYRDAWFVGFAGNMVVGVWVGNDDNTPTKKVTGGNMPAKIWREFMTAALEKDAIVVENTRENYERPRSRKRGKGLLRGLMRSFGF